MSGLPKWESPRFHEWDMRFFAIAKQVATWSKDPSTQVGCVIVNPDRRIVGTGYNGFASRCDDHPEFYADRDRKYLRVIHAEVNAVLNSVASLKDSIVYVTAPCCSNCAAVLIQSGVKSVHVLQAGKGFNDRFIASCLEATTMFTEAGVKYDLCEYENIKRPVHF